MKDWPALDLPDADDLVLAALDECAPTAVEEREPGVRVFFATPQQRDAALDILTARHTAGAAVDVSDEDWAARSQQNLKPITVGSITILPTPTSSTAIPEPSPRGTAGAIGIVIEPSMGFGTGHHATTRLCLAALQTLALTGAEVLDVGTGSGVLAIAAARLGAARAHGIDFDADAIQSAGENLALNPEARGITLAVTDLVGTALPEADVVLANLTGAVLVRSAGALLAAARPGGHLILSGIMASEEDEVRAAYSRGVITHRAQEDEWVCLLVKKR